MTLRRSLVTVPAVLAIALGSFTACSSDSAKTTCGELRGMNADEYIDFLKGVIDDEGDDAKEALQPSIDLLESVPDGAEKDAAVKAAIDATCAGKDDDTELGDLAG